MQTKRKEIEMFVIVETKVVKGKTRDFSNTKLIQLRVSRWFTILFYALSRELYILKYRDSLAYLVVYNWC